MQSDKLSLPITYISCSNPSLSLKNRCAGGVPPSGEGNAFMIFYDF